MAYRYPWYSGLYGDEYDDRDYYEDIVEEDRGSSRGRDRIFRGVDYDHDGPRYAGPYRHSAGWFGGVGVVGPEGGPVEGYGAPERYRDYEIGTGGRGGSRRGTVDRLRHWMHEGPHSGRGPEGYRRADERILDDAHERLTRHGRLDASDIRVRVENSEITLEGTVDSRRSKRLAQDALETVAGVRDIHNRLRIKQG